MKKTICLMIINFLGILFLHSQGDSISCLDLGGGSKIVCSYYDYYGSVYKKVWNSGENVDSTCYFDSSGKKLHKVQPIDQLVLLGVVGLVELSTLKNKIANEFNWNNVVPREGMGTTLIGFVIYPNGSITNIRVIHGSHDSLNKEFMRAVGSLREEDVTRCVKLNIPAFVTYPFKF